MRKWSIFFGLILSMSICAEVAAAAPQPPVLSISTSGIGITASWRPVAGADKYLLVYAPYPMEDESQIGAVDMGLQTSLSVDLWDGASFIVALFAYSGGERSELSNIEVFTLKSGGSSNWMQDIWLGELRYCYSGNCQSQPTVIEFLADNRWVAVTTMDAFGKRYTYEMIGEFSATASSVSGIGNSRLSGGDGWDSSQNVTFNLKLSSSDILSGDWDDGSGAEISARNFKRQ